MGVFQEERPGKSRPVSPEAALALPDDPAIAEHLGDACAKAGYREEALSAYRKALRLNPSSADLLRKIRNWTAAGDP
jgi:Flp pilus assembly protein TadD